jgi:hypothetical protein
MEAFMRKLVLILGTAAAALAAQGTFAVNGDHAILQPRVYDAGKPYHGRMLVDSSSTGASTAPRRAAPALPFEYKDWEHGYIPDRVRPRNVRKPGEGPGSEDFFEFMDSAGPRG